MRQILSALSGSLLIIILFPAALVGWSLLFGWLLTLILPFTLFEGSLLTMIATAFVIHITSNLPEAPVLDDWETDSTPRYMMPVEQFMDDNNDYSWEAWIRYNLANEIDYDYRQHFEDDWPAEEREALAIQMADAAVGILKRKSSRPPNGITANQLRRQLDKMNVQLDHELTLDVALKAINEVTSFPHIELAINKKKWQQPYPVVILDRARGPG